MESPVRVLWVTTKPPWPPDDGGKLLMAQTLSALDPERVEVLLAGPWPLAAPHQAGLLAACPAIKTILPFPAASSLFWRRLSATVSGGFGVGDPITARKHRSRSFARRLESLLCRSAAASRNGNVASTGFGYSGPIDVIHAEQPHSLGLIPNTDTPVLLRLQNVESDLWRGLGEATRWPRGAWLKRQARAVQRWELACIRAVRRSAAISPEDQQRFVSLGCEEKRVICLPPAFPEVLEGGTTPLAGDPSAVLLSGSGWRPNAIGEETFLQICWPAMQRCNPGAHLHVFSAAPSTHDSPFLSSHAFPKASQELFAPGSILLVPAQVTSGIRMKILEAWARGIPVITSRPGARGLSPAARQAVAIADNPRAWSEWLRDLSIPHNAAQQVERGRQALRQDHDPTTLAAHLVSLYTSMREEAGEIVGAPNPSADW